MGDVESAQELVDWATEAGDGHVDILINNAGIALAGAGPSEAATEADFDETFGLNVKAPFSDAEGTAPRPTPARWEGAVL